MKLRNFSSFTHSAGINSFSVFSNSILMRFTKLMLFIKKKLIIEVKLTKIYGNYISVYTCSILTTSKKATSKLGNRLFICSNHQ